jgi:hypothetical protein
VITRGRDETSDADWSLADYEALAGEDFEMSDHDHLVQTLTRLQLTAIRDHSRIFVRDLAGFDFAAQPSLDTAQIREATGLFIVHGEAVLPSGPPGARGDRRNRTRSDWPGGGVNPTSRQKDGRTAERPRPCQGRLRYRFPGPQRFGVPVSTLLVAR